MRLYLTDLICRFWIRLNGSRQDFLHGFLTTRNRIFSAQLLLNVLEKEKKGRRKHRPTPQSFYSIYASVAARIKANAEPARVRTRSRRRTCARNALSPASRIPVERRIIISKVNRGRASPGISCEESTTMRELQGSDARIRCPIPPSSRRWRKVISR